MSGPSCVLAETEPGTLHGLGRALDRLGLGFEIRRLGEISGREEPGTPIVVDARAVHRGRIPLAMATNTTAAPLVLACDGGDRTAISAALACGLCDVLHPDEPDDVLLARLQIASRFAVRRRVLSLRRATLARYAPLERPEPPRAVVPAGAKPSILVAGPGSAAKAAVLDLLRGWSRVIVTDRLEPAVDTTDLDLVLVTGRSSGAASASPPPAAAALASEDDLSRPAPVLAPSGAARDAADVLPVGGPPELLRVRIRAWLAHRAAERELRGAVDCWDRPAIVDPPSRLLAEAFLLDLLDDLLRAPGGADTALVGLGVDGLDELIRRHGRVAGERAVRLVGRAIARHTRAEDLPARFGADRFVIAMPATAQAGADALARRLAVQLATLRTPTGLPLRVSAATAVFRVGQDARRLAGAALDRLDLAAARVL